MNPCLKDLRQKNDGLVKRNISKTNELRKLHELLDNEKNVNNKLNNKNSKQLQIIGGLQQRIQKLETSLKVCYFIIID